MTIEQIREYQLIEKRQLQDIQGIGYLLEHRKSGAKLFLIETEDENKVFNISFLTPPENNTGCEHILEHSVLCGSKKYPAKDPFIELVKGSTNTFLNAITYPDKTTYPVASCNDKDFQNLMSVYMDAVFYPNIYGNKKIFLQEGWHYELESMEQPLIYNGVVYNEMKGAYSDADAIMDRKVKQVLFPNSCYQYDSGGIPEHIVSLTYEDFLNYHKEKYHPSNAYIYLYGNMDMVEKLQWLDKEYLSHFQKQEVGVFIKEQALSTEMIEVEEVFDATEEVEDDGRFTWAKLLPMNISMETIFAFQILDYVLLHAPGAPLKQALLDCNIGKDIYGGFDTDLAQPMFVLNVKGVEDSKREQFKTVITKTLQSIVTEGIKQTSLEAGLNICEFKAREADFGRFPKGLMYGLQCMEVWLSDNGISPFAPLEFTNIFLKLKEKLHTGYFTQLVKEYLLENKGGVIVYGIPQKNLQQKIDKQIEEQLQKIKNQLSKEELHQLIIQTKELKQYQEEPSSKEALESIPMLKTSDIKREVMFQEVEVEQIDDVKLIYESIFTSNIIYGTYLFDCKYLEIEDFVILSILKKCFGKLNTKNYTYNELADEINLYTGGIDFLVTSYKDTKKDTACQIMFEVKVRCSYEKVEKAVGLVKEILFETDWSDKKRLKEMIKEISSNVCDDLNVLGHVASSTRAGSYISLDAYLSDVQNGVYFYEAIKEMEETFDEKADVIIQRFNQVMDKLFVKGNLLTNCTCEKEGYLLWKEQLHKIADNLQQTQLKPVILQPTLEKKNEGIKIPSQVQYVARCGNFKYAGYEYTGSMKVLKTILDYEYLWKQVRVKGGAYGCMTGFSRDGDSYFVSYRDPNMKETNAIYEQLPEYLSTICIDEREMEKYIIGTISEMDIPLTPVGKGERGLSCYLSNITREDLQKERDEVLSTSQESIRLLAKPIQAVLEDNCLCVFGSSKKIDENMEMFSQIKTI